MATAAISRTFEVVSLWYAYLPVYLFIYALYVILREIRIKRNWKRYFSQPGKSSYQLNAERITRSIHMGLISLSILISVVLGLIFFYFKEIPVGDPFVVMPLFVVFCLLCSSMVIGLFLAYRVVTMEEDGGRINMDLRKIGLVHWLSIHFHLLICGVILLIIFLIINSPMLGSAQQPKGGRIGLEEVLSPYTPRFGKMLITGESVDDVRTEVTIIVEERAKTQKREPISEDVDIALIGICGVGDPPGKSKKYKSDIEAIRRKYIGISKDPSLQEQFRHSLTEELKLINRTRLNRFGILDDISVFFRR